MSSFTGGRRVARDSRPARVQLVKEEEEDEKQNLYNSASTPQSRPYAYYVKEEYPERHTTPRQQQPIHATRPSTVPSTKSRKVKTEDFYRDLIQAYKSGYYVESESYQPQHSSRASSIDPEWGPEADDVEIVNQQLTDALEDVDKLEKESDAERRKRGKLEKRIQQLIQEREDLRKSFNRRENALRLENIKIMAKVEKLLDMVARQEFRHRKELAKAATRPHSAHAQLPSDTLLHCEAQLRQVKCPPEALAALAEFGQLGASTNSDLPSAKPSYIPTNNTPRQTPAIYVDDSPIFSFRHPVRAAREAPGMERLSSSTSSRYETASTGSTIVNGCLSCCSDAAVSTPSPVFVGSPDWKASRSLENCLKRNDNGRIGLGLAV